MSDEPTTLSVEPNGKLVVLTTLVISKVVEHKSKMESRPKSTLRRALKLTSIV